MHMMEPLRVSLSGEAARFLQMLRDFGHLDQVALNAFLVVIAEEVGEVNEVPVGLALVRQLAARHLFDRSGEDFRDGSGILVEDWSILFS
jgi:hypothetical protein